MITYIYFNLGRSQSRDYLIRVNCQKKKIFLHINKHLDANVLGEKLQFEKNVKTSHVSESSARRTVEVNWKK